MVKIVRPDARDRGTAQTPGMIRESGVSAATAGSNGLWMGVGRNEPGGASGAHHHGESESGIFILQGRLRFRWGDLLEQVADAEAGDFIYVPPFEIHSEENLDANAEAVFVLARNTMEGIVVNVPDPRGT